MLSASEQSDGKWKWMFERSSRDGSRKQEKETGIHSLEELVIFFSFSLALSSALAEITGMRTHNEDLYGLCETRAHLLEHIHTRADIVQGGENGERERRGEFNNR